jgi:hypothetical protein
MHKTFMALALAAGAALSARPCAAEEPARVGLAMGYPASVGIIWHVSDSVALRPELSFSHASTSTDASSSSPLAFTSTIDSTQVGIGLGALFYVGKWDALRAYVSPQLAYARASGDSTSSDILPVIPGLPALAATPTVSTTVSTYTVTGSVGAEYSLARRFAVFGEVGYGYSRASSSSSSSSVLSTALHQTTNATGTRTAVGVILYF